MRHLTRREFLKQSAGAGLALGIPMLVRGGDPNSEIRIAIVGLGGIDTVGGVGGRGRQLITRFRQVPGAKIVALCDVDKAILDHGARLFRDQGENVSTHMDFRRVLDDKTIDAVVLATPNHWHGLGTIWACQAGKDVYVEKPFSYNIWEGRQMVAAARKYGRIVQVGTQRRSSTVLPKAFEYLRSGQIGPIRFAHALVYRARASIGKVDAPTPVPDTVDYDLWCGPAPKGPLTRKQLHYEWHWMWPTGNGEMGNNGVHMTDICRWGLGQDGPPPRAMSIGGRFAFDDAGETPNTQVAIFDYQPAPIICEIRNVSKNTTPKAPSTLGKFRNTDRGIVIVCEGGYLAADFTGAAAFDNDGKKIQDFQDGRKSGEIETSHAANFIAAIRSRKADSLAADASVGHASAACCHMANISHRLGKQSACGEIRERIRSNGELLDAFERCRANLLENGVNLDATPAVLGPWVTFDARQECFTGEFADQANQLSRREDRAPFIVPKIV
ncbi:MAG TPA: Gfo/Idh/MocA family oxidoreductase [Verrucomicrobiae bacterium]|nr:Gfo/Idh/MocA family oxidoreductase [Verrucomicrobiae bacterium]